MVSKKKGDNNSKKGNKRKKKKGGKKLVILLTILFVIAFASSFLYFYLLSFSNNSKIGDGVANVERKETSNDEPVNILVMGVDYGGPYNKNEPKRTDTMILVSYNPKDKKLNMISIPRDTRVRINGKVQKINAAHAIGGPKYSVDSVESLLGIDVHYYAKLDYEGFRKIIDSIGGIEMKIEQDMYYDDDTQDLHIRFKKGEVVHLDGKKAEEFFRWRQNNDGTGLAEGDLGRIKNQHLFISKVIDKFKSPAIITKIPSIMSTLPKYVETNMKPDEIIKYGYSFLRVDQEDMDISTLKGEAKYVGNVSYFLYDEKANKDLVNSLKGITKETQVQREKLKIQVLNCTNKNGLASEYSSRLKSKGYTDVFIGNGDKREKSKIIIKGVDKDLIDSIKKDFKIDKVESSSYKEGDYNITVLLGEDYTK
ncbi:LCP family protein [Clostridium sp. MSJ-11]|uniref:LCP family protein n=1 Tax=Clostridium mobile TaxID=2841512 RepID=A0ABS6EGF4_9CLOT|nr:LCP family protein [Clostridium mobile]MBU5483550.1 LCP family protein [Clostridium mobile]